MRQNQLRGKILAFLKYLYPDRIDEDGIVSVYYQYYKYDNIKQAIEYLIDKKYISRKKTVHPYKTGRFIKLYKIMPAGIDILEGTATDNGISPERW